jgi:peptidoglycan hydrolase-like protein with peptidoglycan-binding domain
MRLLIILLACIGMAGWAQAENLALVISNGYYDRVSDAPEVSRRHAREVATFEQQGYRVFEGQNLNRLDTRQLIDRFASQLRVADVVVISLQGHFAHYGEKSWLLPTDIDVNSATGLAFRGVDLDFLTQLLAEKPDNAVMFIGETGRQALRIPAVEAGIARLFLPRGVMMVSGAGATVDDILRTRFLRQNVRVSDVLRSDVRGLEIDGDIPMNLVLADGRALALTPEQVEAALGLSRTERRRIQQDLTDLGFNTRGIDGLFGAGTRSAIESWQRRNRLVRTGFLTSDQVALLRSQGDSARIEIQANDRRFWAETGADGSERGLRLYLQRYPNGLFANRARAEIARLTTVTDEQAWAQAAQLDTEAAYRQYLRDFPNGIYKEFARSRIGVVPDNVENDAKRVEDSLRLNPVSRLLIEQRVADLGYRTGPRDGNFDLATRQAFRGYQRDRNLPVTGYVTADMIRRLLLGQ